MPIQAVLASNRLLATLPIEDRLRMMENCESIEVRFAEVLSKPGEPILYAYFPASCVISSVMPSDSGVQLEVGLIGNEGMLGMPLMLGVDTAPFHSAIQCSGLVIRIATPLFLLEIERSLVLQKRLKSYLYVSIRQLAQTATCNRFHEVLQRLARLLLMIRDRTHSDEFHITQELLAHMLGVRRVGVTKAAGSLQHEKFISYSRGEVKIHNVVGLESVSCRCYNADKEIYDHIMNG
ncbi:MAG TPA: Crp/Fnr family transcriptional regulator [Methylophilaceae bacterium]